MLRIRLARVGLKKQPSYRIVVTDSRNARDSRSLETIGYYNPRTRPSTEVVEEDRALYWLSVGAQASEPVARILKRLGTLDRHARVRAGESIEELVKEAVATAKPLPDPRTNYPAPAAGQGTGKKDKK